MARQIPSTSHVVHELFSSWFWVLEPKDQDRRPWGQSRMGVGIFRDFIDSVFGLRFGVPSVFEKNDPWFKQKERHCRYSTKTNLSNNLGSNKHDLRKGTSDKGKTNETYISRNTWEIGSHSDTKASPKEQPSFGEPRFRPMPTRSDFHLLQVFEQVWSTCRTNLAPMLNRCAMLVCGILLHVFWAEVDHFPNSALTWQHLPSANTHDSEPWSGGMRATVKSARPLL